MSTAQTKLMTAEDFYDWVHRPENAERFFELERGEVVEMPPPMKYHGFVCANISGILRTFAIQRKSGYPCSNDSGLIVEHDPDTVRGPDVTFYEDEQTRWIGSIRAIRLGSSLRCFRQTINIPR